MKIVLKKKFINRINRINRNKIIKEIYNSHKNYYNCFSKNKKIKFKIINYFLLKKDTDISNYKIIYYNKKIAGFCSFYNHLQYNNKMTLNLKFALKFIKKRNIKYILNNLKKFNRQFPRYKLLKNYVYLSRILVFKSFQNKGIGKYVMHKIFKNKKVILHVISSNEKAIKFYKKLDSKVINNHHKYFLLKIFF